MEFLKYHFEEQHLDNILILLRSTKLIYNINIINIQYSILQNGIFEIPL